MSTAINQPERNIGKRKHTKNACDACRARKIKCRFLSDNFICDSCRQLALPCTQNRPRKRRGPSSRYVEEVRLQEQARLLQSDTPEVTLPTSSSLHSQSATSIEHVRLEDLAPSMVIEQVIKDWFELIHPVAPILHRDTFLHQLRRCDTVNDREFVSLVISVCAAAVSTMRRRITAYAPMITVEKCYQLITRNDKAQDCPEIVLVRCQWKYNISSALLHERGLDSALIHLITAELASMISHLVHYQLPYMTTRDQELTKRLYWLIYAGACTVGLHGRPFMTSVNPFNSNDILRPREVVDAELNDEHTSQDEWQGNLISYIPGLNALSDLFLLWHRSQLAVASDLSHVEASLSLALAALDNLPPVLRWRGGLSRPPRGNFGTDVQMVNLYITQIHIRASLLDQIHNLARDANNSVTISSILDSRQDLINDMLAIVYQMPEETLEANGHSLIGKLRDIGLTLLNDADSSASASTNLTRLLAKLDRLDVRQANAMDPTSPLSNMTTSTIIL